MNLVTIIPPEKEGSGIMATQGTRVVTHDGQEIHGIQKVELTAEVNDIWRAVITLHARVVPTTAVCWEYIDGLSSLPAWRRWLLKLAGFSIPTDPGAKPQGHLIFDTTSLKDQARHHTVA